MSIYQYAKNGDENNFMIKWGEKHEWFNLFPSKLIILVQLAFEGKNDNIINTVTKLYLNKYKPADVNWVCILMCAIVCNKPQFYDMCIDNKKYMKNNEINKLLQIERYCNEKKAIDECYYFHNLISQISQ